MGLGAGAAKMSGDGYTVEAPDAFDAAWSAGAANKAAAADTAR